MVRGQKTMAQQIKEKRARTRDRERKKAQAALKLAMLNKANIIGRSLYGEGTVFKLDMGDVLGDAHFGNTYAETVKRSTATRMSPITETATGRLVNESQATADQMLQSMKEVMAMKPPRPQRAVEIDGKFYLYDDDVLDSMRYGTPFLNPVLNVFTEPTPDPEPDPEPLPEHFKRRIELGDD